jgi:cytosine/adenosine deaminase-related metal-dependent hydrolase
MRLLKGPIAGLLLILTPAVLRVQSVHFVDVTIVPMDRETTLPGQTVVVRGERIVSIGPTKNAPAPDDAVVINGAGLYLVPGLTDAHVHLAGTVFGPGRPEFGDAPLYLAYITTVFNLGGTPEHLEWRRRLIVGELVGPTIYTSPPFFNEPRVKSPEEVEREIAATVAAGYDLLKFREIVGPNPAPTTVGLSLSAYERMNEAARRARLPLIGPHR